VTLGDADAELAARGFDYLLPSRRYGMLNRAVVDFEDFYSWPWLRKTTTAAAPIAITDLKYIRAVYDSTGVEYFGLDESEDADLTQTGTPTNWWIDDTSGTPTLTAWPAGTVTFRVSYVAESTTLATAGDTPKIPARYHPIWVDQAVVYAYEDSDNFAAAAQLQQQVNARLQQLVERYETRNRMNSGHVLLRAGSEDG
jgi:hypothetical protein